MDIKEISLQRAAHDQKNVLANLLELYQHDMSEAFPVQMSEDGRFGYEKLPLYWTEPDRRFPYLIRAEQGLMGFVLVTQGSPASDDSQAFDVAEFFVLRRFSQNAKATSEIKRVSAWPWFRWL